ncbi:hypothetical protein PEC18_36955 [Paucibacter sp. O1-1]|nr:hypothetical protein [Paucibacter sp. O1-1]MDA3831244.1 hypothetical protein [Paucibacter sp. O1-1]
MAGRVAAAGHAAARECPAASQVAPELGDGRHALGNGAPARRGKAEQDQAAIERHGRRARAKEQGCGAQRGGDGCRLAMRCRVIATRRERAGGGGVEFHGGW